MRLNSTHLIGTLFILLNLFFVLLVSSALILPETVWAKRDNRFTVVVDAGHGGSDYGGISTLLRRKVAEKDITLKLAQKVGRLLKNRRLWKGTGKNVKVVYTRYSDKTVDLERRAAIVKKHRADLLVSIHANAEQTGRARGIETYFLNNTTSKTARKLEQIHSRKNRRMKKRAHPRYRKPSTDLLLKSVRADAMISLSRQAARSIQKNVIRRLKKARMSTLDRGIKQDILYVLLDSGTPAVLFEAPFITNRRDVKNLVRGDYQQKIAEGIVMGIVDFARSQK